MILTSEGGVKKIANKRFSKWKMKILERRKTFKYIFIFEIKDNLNCV